MSDLITDTVAVGQADGFVMLEFPKPVKWAKFDPETAKNIGIAMAKESHHLVTGNTKDGARVITEEVRAKLIVRVGHVIRSLEEKGKAHTYTAAQVVDTVLAEVS